VTGVSVYPPTFPYVLRVLPTPRWVYVGDHTHINFTLSESCYVTISINNNQTGVLVRTLLGKLLPLPMGMNSVTWDGKYSNGTAVANGVYKIRIYVTDRAGNNASPYPIVTYVNVYRRIIIIP
jgi:flagellar hook assembly protein FlgD